MKPQIVVLTEHTPESMRDKLTKAGVSHLPKRERAYQALTPQDVTNGALPKERKARVGQGQVADEVNARPGQIDRLLDMVGGF